MSFYDKERIKELPTDMIKKATLITDIVKVGIDPDAIMRTHLSVTFFKGGGGVDTFAQFIPFLRYIFYR